MAEYVIEENDAGRRVDRVVRSFFKKTCKRSSLSEIYSYFRKGLVRLNGKKVSPSTLTSIKDVLYIRDDTLLEQNRLNKNKCGKVSEHIESEKLEILLKTGDLLFVNKRLGIATHGKSSIDEAVKNYFACFSLSFSPGALHRLDKNTTGVLTFSQSLKGAREFSKSIKNGNVFRYYIGINEGCVKNSLWKLKYKTEKGKLTEEITKVFLIEYSKKAHLSLVSYRLFTGKKHQIRRGASHFGTPLFCDAKYNSKRRDYQAYFLHSFAIHFDEPIFLDVPQTIIAPLTKNFMLAISKYFPKSIQSINKSGASSFFRHLLEKTNES